MAALRALFAAATVAGCARVAAAIATAVQAHGVAAAVPEFDHLRRSVVRIQAVSSQFDWLQPFLPGSDGVGLGSGFAVMAEPYPLFVTNAHVISDAKQVTLQLLLFGAEQWGAEVVSVCSKFDLAILALQEPAAFLQALASRNITLEPLRLASGAVAMGEDVVALGFPLGQDALKISKGNIAGNEDVNGNICIQSTAPISPGNSGGPLLDARAEQVVGVNFAKAAEGENINYVIPAWRVKQLVAKHLREQPTSPPEGQRWRRVQVQVPEADLTTIEANRALYTMSGGCAHGIYVSRVGKRSFLSNAQPPVVNGSFLVSVNGRTLDSFGTALHEEYAADRVRFTDLFFMVPDLAAEMEVETCRLGATTRHAVSLAWAPEYERGLRFVNEPYIAGIASEYEMFGDISIMQMTVNHISTILASTGDPGPARWLHPDFVTEPRLIVNYVRSGSYASGVVAPGAAVSKVNGRAVRTLAELREHFQPEAAGDNVWTLETDMGSMAAVLFNESLAEQVARATRLNAPYLLTPGVRSAAINLGLKLGDSRMRSSTAQGAHKLQQKPEHMGLVRRAAAAGAAVRKGSSAENLAVGASGQEAVAGSAASHAELRLAAAGPLTVTRLSRRLGMATAHAAHATWHLPEV